MCYDSLLQLRFLFNPPNAVLIALDKRNSSVFYVFVAMYKTYKSFKYLLLVILNNFRIFFVFLDNELFKIKIIILLLFQYGYLFFQFPWLTLTSLLLLYMAGECFQVYKI